MVAVQFSDQISVGNILTVALMLLGGLGAFFELRSQNRTNKLLIEQLEKRFEKCNVEQLQERVDIMWAFQIRRGILEVERSGLGQSNSPLKLTDEAYELMSPLIPDLKQFYLAIKGEELGLVELAIRIEEQFGTRIAEQVCRKAGVSDGACLVLAIGMLRPISLSMVKTAKQLCEEIAHDTK